MPFRSFVRQWTRIVRLTLPLGVLGGAAVSSVTGCGAFIAASNPRPAPGDSLVARNLLNSALKEYWVFALKRRADLAIANGIDVTDFSDFSFESIKEDGRFAASLGRDLTRVNVEALSSTDYLTLLALQWELDMRAEGVAFVWPDFSDFSPATTPLRDAIGVLRAHPLATAPDAERYVFLLEGVPLYLDRIRAGLETRRERGMVASRAVVRSGLAFFRGLRALGAGDPWTPAPPRLTTLDSGARTKFSADAGDAITHRLLPSLDSLTAYLETVYLPVASEREGVWQYPGGKELYRHLVRRYSSLDVLPDQAHRVGLAELRRVDSLMAGARTRLGWKGSIAAFHDSLRALPRARASGADVVRILLDAQARVLDSLPSRFPALPIRAPVVRDATPLETLLHPDGFYRPAAASDSSGELLLTPRWQSPSSLISIASRSSRSLSPGRHLQQWLMWFGNATPVFRRLHPNEGFTAGWEEYAASLTGELGLYGDPLDAYGRLLDEGFAIALLVVDTGVHYLGWTRAQALNVLRAHSLESDATLDTLFTERVLNAPGRSTAAALGARELAAMRAWAAREEGASFSLRDWHGTMLSQGALPLSLMATHVELWLYERGRARRTPTRAPAPATRP